MTVAVLDGNEYKEKTLTVKLGKDDSASKDSSEESAAQDSQDSQDSQDESIEGGQDGSDQEMQMRLRMMVRPVCSGF